MSCDPCRALSAGASGDAGSGDIRAVGLGMAGRAACLRQWAVQWSAFATG